MKRRSPSPSLPRTFRGAGSPRVLGSTHLGSWRPVSEWEVLSHQESDKAEHVNLRRMMSESIFRLAKSGRELLYRVDILPVRNIGMELAMATKGYSPERDSFKYFGCNEALHAVHRSLRERSRVEATVVININLEENMVDIDLLNRNMAFPSLPVETSSPKSKVAKVMLCFALAMAGEICISMSADLTWTKVTLYAADDGSGKLLQYYEKEYGLRKEGLTNHMEGLLQVAIGQCGRVWESDDDIHSKKSEDISQLKQVTDELKKRRLA